VGADKPHYLSLIEATRAYEEYLAALGALVNRGGTVSAGQIERLKELREAIRVAYENQGPGGSIDGVFMFRSPMPRLEAWESVLVRLGHDPKGRQRKTRRVKAGPGRRRKEVPPELERDIRRRIARSDDPARTLNAIAKRHGVSESLVRSIEKRLKRPAKRGR